MESRTRTAYRRREADTTPLGVWCWCGCTTVIVTADEIRRGVTRSCGRRFCDALSYSNALTASGEPCDCDKR